MAQGTFLTFSWSLIARSTPLARFLSQGQPEIRVSVAPFGQGG